MGKYEHFITELMQQSNGYLHIRDLEKYGVERMQIYPAIKRMHLKKAARGVYCAGDMRPDLMYLTCLRNKEVILSHESAAFLYSLLPKEPERVSVTVAHSYNTKHLEEKWIICYQADRRWLDIGKEQIVDSYGNSVCSYNAERVICDFIREKDFKRQEGNKLLPDVINAYFGPEYPKNLERLQSYAEMLGILDRVEPYLQELGS